jgi:acyl-CoA thioesterase-1
MKIVQKLLLCIFALILSISLQACSKPKQSEKNAIIPSANMERLQTIYVLWDSLSAGYRLALEQSYPMLVELKLLALWYKIKVINGWESGDTSAGLKERLAWITADASTWDIALVVIGANDGLQWLDTVTLVDNLKEIISSLQTRGIQTIVWGMLIPTNFGNKYREDFEAVFPDVAKATQSQIIPFILTGVAGNPELNLPDGIHPNETGQLIVAETVTQFLIQSNLLKK